MPTTYSILGQSAPANTSNADILTAASATSYVISSLVIANTTTSAATARVFVRKNSAAAAASNAILYDVSIPANSTATFTLGITVTFGSSADIITVQSGTANALTFHLFGSAIS